MDSNDVLSSRKYEEAQAVEKVHFDKTDRMVNPKKVKPYKLWEGSVPVLIVASHAVRHLRKKKIKPSDIFTGSLAYQVAEISNCYGFAVTKLYGGDPNYDKDCIVKKEISKICKDNNIKLLLDLHGANREKNFDIDIGTMNGESFLGRHDLKDKITRSFKNSGLKHISFDYFPAKVQNTVTRYAVEEINIPAFQIEINRKYRAPNKSGSEYNKVLAALTSFVLEVKQEKWM